MLGARSTQPFHPQPRLPRLNTSVSRFHLPAASHSHHHSQGRTLPILPPERPPSVFRFKHFDVAQGNVAMKMGTDAMILGSWVQTGTAARRILDVGCGTGVLALMAAQRAQAGAIVHAIDVDDSACVQATQNAAASPFADMVHVFKLSYQELVQQARDTPTNSNSSGGGSGSYDLIISNPPYFQDSFKSLEDAREARRVRRSRHSAQAASSPQPATATAVAEAAADERSVPKPAATIMLEPPSPEAQARGSGANAEGASTADADAGHCASGSAVGGNSISISGSGSSMSSSGGSGGGSESSQSPASRQHQRLRARHADADQGLPYEELIEGATLLLAAGGRLCVILPCTRGEADRFAACAHAQGFVLHNALRVATRDEDPQPKRACMEFIKAQGAAPTQGLDLSECPLLVTMQTKRVADGWVRCPTPEYIALTRDFHHPALIAQMTIPLRKKAGAS